MKSAEQPNFIENEDEVEPSEKKFSSLRISLEHEIMKRYQKRHNASNGDMLKWSTRFSKRYHDAFAETVDQSVVDAIKEDKGHHDSLLDMLEEYIYPDAEFRPEQYKKAA